MVATLVPLKPPRLQGAADTPGIPDGHSEHAQQKFPECPSLDSQVGLGEIQINRSDCPRRFPQVSLSPTVFPQGVPESAQRPVPMVKDETVMIILADFQLKGLVGNVEGQRHPQVRLRKNLGGRIEGGIQ